MKKTPDKIKDFVEPQIYEDVQNFINDPARALAAYRFTDATADLLTRWLDALADLPRGRGAARALAGLRGVGKTHTLATLGSIVGVPTLRSTITDAHVATSARRLAAKKYMVARVERGTKATLTEEIIEALKKTFGGDQTQWGTDPVAMLAVAASRANDSILLLIIDTSFGRDSRVDRDDGPILGQLATAVQYANIFIALALDDDIAGADGVNIAIARTYQIDYLDPEHLYRVADLYVLQKKAEGREELHNIYLGLRSLVPGFNWSEPRFAAVYPVHPIIADVAPAVRLYARTFAFLPFAAAATAQSLMRTAFSLIVLDEVFDRTEKELRQSEDLHDAFAIYDHLETQAIAQLGIMQRLQAKLILKGLFILSLDGRGATANELCAAMLFYDESSPGSMRVNVERTLSYFANAAPRGLLTKQTETNELRYRFNVGASAGFDAALAAKVETIAPNVSAVNNLLFKMARTRFEDWPVFEETSNSIKSANFITIWRGSERRGQLNWIANDVEEQLPPPLTTLQGPPFYDWEIMILASGITVKSIPQAPAYAIWKPAALTEEDLEILYRLIALREDTSLFAEYSGTARAAETSLAAQAERIWTRIYIDQATFVTSEYTHVFNTTARSTQRLSEALAQILAPAMGARYPEHPVFAERINDNDVMLLVDNAFGTGSINNQNVQKLLGHFAAPLGLASLRNGSYALHTSDELLSRSWVREVLAMADEADGEMVSLEAIRHKLRRGPYGLTKESRHLILAALVSQRLIELTTLKGELLGRRDLDQTLKWNEIAGFCRSTTILHTAEELTVWARLLTNKDDLPVITDVNARELVRQELNDWLNTWNTNDLLYRLDTLPDEALTIRVSNMAASIRKTFCAAAKAVEETLTDNVSLDEGLQRIADAFSGSIEVYERSAQHLRLLTEFVHELDEWFRIRNYLSAVEPTRIYQIESARRELISLSEDIHNIFDEELRHRFNLLWQNFHSYYMEHYAIEHNRIVGPDIEMNGLDQLELSQDWYEFRIASQELSIANKETWEEAEQLMNKFTTDRCNLPVLQILNDHPFCACGFRLSKIAERQRILEEVRTTIYQGRSIYRRTLSVWGKNLARAVEDIALNSTDSNDATTAERLIKTLEDETIPDYLTPAELLLIERALQSTVLPPVRVNLPVESYGLLTRQELRARIEQWLEELPDHPAFIQVVSNTE